jgi:uncharacterized protein involved in exopolysaccharide biosynthesis/Mrp family chromosome partitioning ATPase
MFEAPRQIKSLVLTRDDFPAAAAAPAEIDFRKIWSTLWDGRTTILLTIAASLLLAALFVLVAPHRFTAATQILIDPTDLRAVTHELSPASQVSDAALLQVESQVRVLGSDDVLRRVVDSEGLARDPEFARGPSLLRALTDRLLGLFGLGHGSVAADPTLTALNDLRRRVQVKRAERTYVVEVSVSSDDPAKAARLANAVAQAYLLEQTQVRADAARQISQSLTARLNELKERVHQAEERVETFKASNNIVGVNGQLVNEQQLSDLNNQLAAARGRTGAAKARLDQVEVVQRAKGEIGAFPEAVQSPTITALRTQYAEIMRREAEQMTSLGERHPAVIEIQAQAARLRRMIDEEINRLALSARAEYESAKSGEDSLARNVEALKQNAMTTNSALVPLRELERDVQASRAVYEAFLVRARETGEQELVDTKNIQVISKADMPLVRTWPPSNTILALGAVFFGFAAGTGFVMFRATLLGAPPRRRDGPSRRMPAPSRKASLPVAAAPQLVPVLATLPGVENSLGLDEVEDPASPFAREIRKVYEAVRASHTKRGSPSILIIAPGADDDTAAVALTLAALAAETQRVLLIDADLERRTLSAIDADESEAGLVDVAIGRLRLTDVVVHDRGTNINLVPFVSPNSRRDRRIEDEDIETAFAQTKNFDMVIVAGIDFGRDPSARFFAGLVDHIVLVTRANEADESAVDECVSRLGLDARKVRGTVLTGAQAA